MSMCLLVLFDFNKRIRKEMWCIVREENSGNVTNGYFGIYTRKQMP